MKIELVKQITRYTGDVYYYVTIDGNMVIGSWTADEAKAEEYQIKQVELVREYPETVTQVIKTIEL